MNALTMATAVDPIPARHSHIRWSAYDAKRVGVGNGVKKKLTIEKAGPFTLMVCGTSPPYVKFQIVWSSPTETSSSMVQVSLTFCPARYWMYVGITFFRQILLFMAPLGRSAFVYFRLAPLRFGAGD